MRTPVIPRSAGPTTTLPEPFTLHATVTLDDRVTALIFAYRDMVAATRRRLAIFVGIVVFVMLMISLGHAWTGGGKQNLEQLWPLFMREMTGGGGAAALFIAVPGAFYAFVYPALARRRMRRWFRDEGLDAPMTVRYDFTPGGLATSMPGHHSAIACRRIKALDETPQHVFITPTDIEDLFVLPKRDLSAEDLANLRLWSSFCQVAGPGAALADPAADAGGNSAPDLAVRFVLTEADRAAAIRRQQQRPGMRRRRRRVLISSVVIAALLAPMVIAFLWALDSDRVQLRYAAPLYAEMFLTHFWKWALGLSGIVGVFGLAQPFALRWNARQLAKAMQDRIKHYENAAVFSAAGLEVRQDGLSNHYDWAHFSGVEREGEHLFLCRPRSEPLLLPVRVLDSDQMMVFDRLVKTHIGRSETRRTEDGA